MKQPDPQLNMFGNDKNYQKVARDAFPILIQLTRIKETITYGELAKKIGVSNARNLDYPLGSISTTLYELQEEWAEEIPRIDIPRLTSIVVSKDTRLPSYPPGITPSEFEDVQKTIYNFPLWTSVLEAIVNKGFSQV